MRIINIVENLDKGAVENWLVNIFLESRKTRPNWHWTFYCILGRHGRLDEKVRIAGGEIIYSPVSISNKVEFLKHLRATLCLGNYDILHSHHDFLSGFYLIASIGIKFRKRILQVHNTDNSLPIGNWYLQKLLLVPLKKLGICFSDTIVGISNDTLEHFLNNNRVLKRKGNILYYGIDLKPFEENSNSINLRTSLGIPADAEIILFVGRMNVLKNPIYVVEILSELLKVRNNVYALFVGSGDLEPEIKRRATELGILKNTRILGWSDNTSIIMKSSNVFVFPRIEYPKEGLGLVVVEAQAAGLPMVITKGIVDDAIVIQKLAYYNSLDSKPAVWANQIDKILQTGPRVTQKEALELMKKSKFDLGIATANLISLYER